MNDMTLNLESIEPTDQPYAAVFAIEQELLKQQQHKTLDALEKGAIQFQSRPSFEPHDMTVQSVQHSTDGDKALISGSLLSLSGANGILPSHYAETIARTLRDKNSGFKDFLDIFNHRLSSLMYRSWAKYRLDADKTYQAHVQQHRSVIDLIMTTFAGESFPCAETSSLYFAGLGYSTSVSSSKLKNLLTDLTGLAVAINEFQGKWIELEEEQLSRLSSRKQGHRFNQLGVDSMLGRRCWDLSSGFEIEFEVDDAQTFARLTPGGDLNRRLKTSVKKLVGDNFDIHFKLKVNPAYCQRVQLGQNAKASKLGASAWMGRNGTSEQIIDYYC